MDSSGDATHSKGQRWEAKVLCRVLPLVTANLAPRSDMSETSTVTITACTWLSAKLACGLHESDEVAALVQLASFLACNSLRSLRFLPRPPSHTLAP